MLARYHQGMKELYSKNLEERGMLARHSTPSNDAKLVGSLGASKGGVERAKVLKPKERSKIASKAAKTRWVGSNDG